MPGRSPPPLGEHGDRVDGLKRERAVPLTPAHRLPAGCPLHPDADMPSAGGPAAGHAAPLGTRAQAAPDALCGVLPAP
ncbi:hypothetical protein SUDANB6_04520 [Streptomyces sp. enrichment culture]